MTAAPKKNHVPLEREIVTTITIACLVSSVDCATASHLIRHSITGLIAVTNVSKHIVLIALCSNVWPRLTLWHHIGINLSHSLYFQPSAAMKPSAERMKEIVGKIPIACQDSSVERLLMPALKIPCLALPQMLVAAISVSFEQLGYMSALLTSDHFSATCSDENRCAEGDGECYQDSDCLDSHRCGMFPDPNCTNIHPAARASTCCYQR